MRIYPKPEQLFEALSYSRGVRATVTLLECAMVTTTVGTGVETERKGVSRVNRKFSSSCLFLLLDHLFTFLLSLHTRKHARSRMVTHTHTHCS